MCSSGPSPGAAQDCHSQNPAETPLAPGLPQPSFCPAGLRSKPGVGAAAHPGPDLAGGHAGAHSARPGPTPPWASIPCRYLRALGHTAKLRAGHGGLAGEAGEGVSSLLWLSPRQWGHCWGGRAGTGSEPQSKQQNLREDFVYVRQLRKLRPGRASRAQQRSPSLQAAPSHFGPWQKAEERWELSCWGLRVAYVGQQELLRW